MMNSRVSVCILDYGSGNVASVSNAFSSLGLNNVVSNLPDQIRNSSHLVLPGVGAFGSSMQCIEATIPLGVVRDEIDKGKPFLGICVGMQVLATQGFEDGDYAGLNILPGKIIRLEGSSVPIPHVGWNNLSINGNNPLFYELDGESDFYFVHSYHMVPDHQDIVLATTNYEIDFVSAVHRENVFGVQFHPEKSQKNGKKLLTNFVSLN